MREIKFRAWDKVYEKWAKLPDHHWYSYSQDEREVVIDGGSLELMQFTGLLDKNGKEIYEGDILKSAGIVAWNDVGLRWSCIDIEWNDKREWHDMLYLTTPLEVIGNIYEAPELLNSDQVDANTKPNGELAP